MMPSTTSGGPTAAPLLPLAGLDAPPRPRPVPRALRSAPRAHRAGAPDVCGACHRGPFRFLRRGLCRSCYRTLDLIGADSHPDLRGEKSPEGLTRRDLVRLWRSELPDAVDAVLREVFAEPRPTPRDALSRALDAPIAPDAAQETDR